MFITINPVTPEKVDRLTRQPFEKVERKLGRIPNGMWLLANSPAALNAYLSFSAPLSEGRLSLNAEVLKCAKVHDDQVAESSLPLRSTSLSVTSTGLHTSEISLPAIKAAHAIAI